MEIQKLDFILNKMLEKGFMVQSQIMYQSEFYVLDNANNDRMETEFKSLLMEFKKLGVGEVVDGGKGVRTNENSQEFKDNGGFKGHYERIEKEKVKATKESKKESDRTGLKDEIDRLTKSNLRLKSWDIKFRWAFYIISFLAGIFIQYKVEIVKFLIELLPK